MSLGGDDLNPLNPQKVSSMKMRFFAMIPAKWRSQFDKIGCLKRNENYEKFEKGIKQYEEAIDIMNLLRDLKLLKLAVKEL